MKTKITKLLNASLPCLITGDFGTGKSSILRQIAQDNNRVCIDLRVAMMPPEDLVGIPRNVGDECFQYLPPNWVHNHKDTKGGDLMIVLEEIHLAPPAMHAALYQLVQEKVVAGVDLSNAWVAATANPPSQAGAAFCADLPEALTDRFELIQYHPCDSSIVWLKNLANELGISSEMQKACGLDGFKLPMTPRACERLLRLIASGVDDSEMLARRAGNMTSAVLACLQDHTTVVEIDILAKTATQDRAKSNWLFGSEGFTND